jgi:hypothetical protein
MGARLALHVASALPDEFVAAAGIHPAALVTDQPDSPHRDVAGVSAELYFAFAETDRTATRENVDQFRRTSFIVCSHRSRLRRLPLLSGGRPNRQQLPQRHTHALGTDALQRIQVVPDEPWGLGQVPEY